MKVRWMFSMSVRQSVFVLVYGCCVECRAAARVC